MGLRDVLRTWARRRVSRGVAPPSALPAGSPWPDTFGEEGARLAEAGAPTGGLGAQPTPRDLADPRQNWIEVTMLGEAQPRYVRGPHLRYVRGRR